MSVGNPTGESTGGSRDRGQHAAGLNHQEENREYAWNYQRAEAVEQREWEKDDGGIGKADEVETETESSESLKLLAMFVGFRGVAGEAVVMKVGPPLSFAVDVILWKASGGR